MFYTAFSLHHITPEAKPKAIAAICHVFAGCACEEGCKCAKGQSCDTCRYTHRSQYHDLTVVDLPGGVIVAITTRKGTMMQVDVWTDKQFDFHGLRVLAEALRMFSENAHLTMTHVHRDRLTEE